MQKILILFILALLIGSMAYATETRVYTMGEANNVVKDEANIWLYPSTINYYPNLFLGDISYYSIYSPKSDYSQVSSIGANFGIGQDGESPSVIGAYFSLIPYHHEIINYINKSETYADQRIHLIYGRNLGGMPFGFSLGYYNDGDKNEDVDDYDDNYEDGLTRYEFAAGLSPMNGKLDVGVMLAMTSWTDKAYSYFYTDGEDDSGMVDITKPDGNMDFSISARYWMDPIGNYVLVPHLAISFEKQGIEYHGSDDTNWVNLKTDKINGTVFDLGCGVNYEADEDVLVIGDFGITLDNWKYEWTNEKTDNSYENEDNYLVLPYFRIGIDAKVVKWLDLRAGALTEWTRNTDEWTYTYPAADDEDAYKRVYSYSSVYTYLGAGLHWGKFEIDAEINPSFLTNGPYFISGKPTIDWYRYEGMAGLVSLKYDFD